MNLFPSTFFKVICFWHWCSEIGVTSGRILNVVSTQLQSGEGFTGREIRLCQILHFEPKKRVVKLEGSSPNKFCESKQITLPPKGH